jgi:hypothetical protein
MSRARKRHWQAFDSKGEMSLTGADCSPRTISTEAAGAERGVRKPLKTQDLSTTEHGPHAFALFTCSFANPAVEAYPRTIAMRCS